VYFQVVLVHANQKPHSFNMEWLILGHLYCVYLKCVLADLEFQICSYILIGGGSADMNQALAARGSSSVGSVFNVNTQSSKCLQTWFHLSTQIKSTCFAARTFSIVVVLLQASQFGYTDQICPFTMADRRWPRVLRPCLVRTCNGLLDVGELEEYSKIRTWHNLTTFNLDASRSTSKLRRKLYVGTIWENEGQTRPNSWSSWRDAMICIWPMWKLCNMVQQVFVQRKLQGSCQWQSWRGTGVSSLQKADLLDRCRKM